MVNRLFGFMGSALSLVGLYLLLRNAGGATSIFNSLSQGTVQFFRTLQGR